MTRHQQDQLAYYTSDLLDGLGLKHGFFTRLGGVSPKPFDSLNVKRDVGDKEVNVFENRKRICQALELDYGRLVFAYLGHEERVRIARKADAGSEVTGYDALITGIKNLPLALSIADCVPIILADQGRTMVAIIHVSWRSLVAGVIPSTLQRMPRNGLIAAIGPCIAAPNYEIKQDVVNAVKAATNFATKVIVEKAGKTYLDLRLACQLQLKQQGVGKIENINIDTFSHTDEFFSYRAEGRTGRFAAIVSL